MSYELLEKIISLPLPCDFSGDDVDLLKAYAAAGFVVAEFSAADIRNHIEQTAQVSKVTPSGRKVILKNKGFR